MYLDAMTCSRNSDVRPVMASVSTFRATSGTDRISPDSSSIGFPFSPQNLWESLSPWMSDSSACVWMRRAEACGCQSCAKDQMLDLWRKPA